MKNGFLQGIFDLSLRISFPPTSSLFSYGHLSEKRTRQLSLADLLAQRTTHMDLTMTLQVRQELAQPLRGSRQVMSRTTRRVMERARATMLERPRSISTTTITTVSTLSSPVPLHRVRHRLLRTSHQIPHLRPHAAQIQKAATDRILVLQVRAHRLLLLRLSCMATFPVPTHSVIGAASAGGSNT